MAVLVRRYVQPRIPRLRRRFHRHMMEEWDDHLDQAERAARVLRYIENYCDDEGDVYRTFTLERLASTVSDTRYSVDFSNRTIEEAGFLDAYEAHASEILAGLRPEHYPDADKEVLREMGSPDVDAELADLVFRARPSRGARARGWPAGCPCEINCTPLGNASRRPRKVLMNRRS